jgi:spore coat polysaccharide biosynthesis predicted glycosyltransferase SpsG
LIAELDDRTRPQGELEISGWVDDLSSRMRTADLAIGAGGVSNYERLHVGLPAVVLTLAPNQQESCAALHGEGLIVNEGPVDDVSADRLADAVVRLAEDTEVRREIARRGPALVDGSGAARCAEAVHALIR